MELSRLLEAIAVAAELTGTELSEAAVKVMAQDLARFPEEQVFAALTRCRRELGSGQRLTVAAVVQRLDDGRPGVEEAWAMIPKSEGATVVWTSEMAEAYGICAPLIDHDEIAARMAFKENYAKALNTARNASTPVKWMPSLGQDQYGREGVLMDAVAKGRLTLREVSPMLPHLAPVADKDFGRLLKAMP
jgi:hypothetical protein